MAEIVLSHREQVALRDLFEGKPRPPGVLPGSWHRLAFEKFDSPDLDVLDAAELRAFAAAEPEVLRILDLAPERG